MLSRYLVVLALVAGAWPGEAHGDDPVVTSFPGNGTLSWEHAATTGLHTVEWAPSLTGTWSRSWAHLVELPATGGTSTVEVPMFLRVLYVPFSTVEDEVIAVADGSSTFYFGYVRMAGLATEGFSIKVPPDIEFSDAEGDGTLAGTPTGQGGIVYPTGAWFLNLGGVAPTAGTEFTASYGFYAAQTPTVRDELVGEGDGVAKMFVGNFAQSGLVTASVTLVAGGLPFTDLDGNGDLEGHLLGSGTVDYPNGSWTLDLGESALGSGAQIRASYQYGE